MRKILIPAIGVFISGMLCVVPGCGDGSGSLLSGKGESCGRTADCQDPLRCINKVCVDDPNLPGDDALPGDDSGHDEDVAGVDAHENVDAVHDMTIVDAREDADSSDALDTDSGRDASQSQDSVGDTAGDLGDDVVSDVPGTDSTVLTPEAQCLSTAGSCWIDGVCLASGDKKTASGCQICNGLLNQRSWSNLPSATACDDGQLCTYGDQCDNAGKCAGIAIVCNNADATTCGRKRVCNGTDTCTSSFPDTATGCDDGNQCTFADHCNGSGTCIGTTIVCSDDDSSTCSRKRKCNGTSVCTTWFPDEKTQCSDSDDCTYSDRCDGSGACSGTGITCTSDAGPCGTVRTCNGTSSCSVAIPDAAIACNDSDQCTYSDRCNGAGGCAGTPISCDDDVCVTRSCNGTESCAVSGYSDIGIGCDDGDSCTADDACDGNGGCLGVGYSCNGHGTCDGMGGCACYSGYSGATCSECSDGARGTYPDCFKPTQSYCKTALCYTIAPTGETGCSNASASLVSCPGTAGSATCGTTAFCGQDAQYPDTGRTYTCYSASGVATSCADLGGALVNETVLDSMTGLMWQRTFASGLNYAQSVAYCEDLEYFGKTDWRLPTIVEIEGIVSLGTTAPAVDTKAFPSSSLTLYSSTLSTDATGYAWTLKFDKGTVEKLASSSNAFVRCVRGAPVAPESDSAVPPHLVLAGTPEGPAYRDLMTGLYWQDTYVYKTWQGALAYCESLSYGGYDNWRLPNRNELLSVVDYSRSQPASSLPHVLGTGQYWTSDTLVTDRSSGWLVYMGNGAVSTASKTSNQYVMCVR